MFSVFYRKSNALAFELLEIPGELFYVHYHEVMQH